MEFVTTPLAYTVDFEYNEMRRLTGQADSLGRATRYRYDLAGCLTEEINPLVRSIQREGWHKEYK